MDIYAARAQVQEQHDRANQAYIDAAKIAAAAVAYQVVANEVSQMRQRGRERAEASGGNPFPALKDHKVALFFILAFLGYVAFCFMFNPWGA